jgi:hypothetical protein
MPCPIIDPHETKQAFPLDRQGKDLFREMCVFGKLNFVQPPSCLSCALTTLAKEPVYQSPSLSPFCAQNNGHCQNRVVWRKNANRILDPDSLDGNILLVTCATAQAWLRGEAVNDWIWDVENRVLYHEELTV